MRIHVNGLCNVLTGDDSQAYRSPAAPERVAPQITVPRLRLRLRVAEARELAAALLEAAERAEQEI